MTIPRDVARCHGRLSSRFTGSGYAPIPVCRDCQRRTAPMEDNTLYSFMTTPEFDPDGSCPLRIPPHV